MDSPTIGLLAMLAMVSVMFGYIVSLVLRLALRDQPPPHPPPRWVSPEEAAHIVQAQVVRETQIREQFGDIFKPGAAFDASAIAPRLRRLRANFPGEARTRRPLSHLRACLVAATRRTLRQRPFFRDHPPLPPFAPPAPHHTQTPA